MQPDGDLGGYAGDGVAAGLAGEGGGTADAGVDLDEVVLEALGVERELHVAAAFNLQRADDFQRAVPEHLVFLIGQRLAWADDDRVARVHAHGVEVFHVANGDGGVVGVPHHLVFNFLEALDALFHQHLPDGGELQGVFHQRNQLRLVVGKAAARTAQRERGAEDDGIADLVCGFDAFLHRGGDRGGQHRLAQRLAELLKLVAVFRLVDTVKARAQDFHLALLQHALGVQAHGEVQARLPAKAGQDGVRPLKAQDLGYVLKRQRFHVNLIGNVDVRHDGGGVGVDEDHLVPLLAQRQAGLRARVVKLRGLADHNRAGADHQHALDVRPLRHAVHAPFPSGR